MKLTYRYLGYASEVTIPGVGTVKRGETVQLETGLVHQWEETTRHRFEIADDAIYSLLLSDGPETQEVTEPAPEPAPRRRRRRAAAPPEDAGTEPVAGADPAADED